MKFTIFRKSNNIYIFFFRIESQSVHILICNCIRCITIQFCIYSLFPYAICFSLKNPVERHNHIITPSMVYFRQNTNELSGIPSIHIAAASLRGIISVIKKATDFHSPTTEFINEDISSADFSVLSHHKYSDISIRFSTAGLYTFFSLRLSMYLK